MADSGAFSGPRDAAVMEAILKEMGIEDYEPNVINHMLEFSYRYVTNILEDARVYSEHAQKKEIDLSDVKLAVQTRMDHSFTAPPPREFLIEVARKKNASPLPLIPEKFGPRLPPERYCLTANNYTIMERKKPSTLNKPQVTLSATFRVPNKLVATSPSTIRGQLTSPLLQTKSISLSSPSITKSSTQPSSLFAHLKQSSTTQDGSSAARSSKQSGLGEVNNSASEGGSILGKRKL